MTQKAKKSKLPTNESLDPSSKAKPLHFNVPQQLALLVQPQKFYGVWSRGVGKSHGAIAPYVVNQSRLMPRSQGGIVGATFQQLLVRTLPPVIAMWERMGYVRDTHFIVGREPDKVFKKLWNWEGPRHKPLDSKYAIYWFNGSCQVMISQDRIGSSNGLSLAYIVGDEAKLLNKERLDEEVMPTLRGDRSHYGHIPTYRGEFFTTDRPTNAAGQWIHQKAELMDKEQIQLILQFQLKINLLQRQLLTLSGQAYERILLQIQDYENRLVKLRKNSVYYSEANVYDNIDVLGEEYIDDMRIALSDSMFRTSILNERLLKIEGGFYGLLDANHHGTDWFDNDYLDRHLHKIGQPFQPNSRQDLSFNRKEPLDIALDYGSSINCMVVGQLVGKQYRIGNSFYVLHPKLTEDVVNEFCDYYEDYPEKTVNYFYDHTAITGNGTTEWTYASVVIETLRNRNWHVNEIYVGQAPKHDRKYEFWGTLLKEKDPRLPVFRYSKTHCESLEISMNNAGVKYGRNGFQKDKTPERDPAIPPQEAPHLSDAADTLVFFRLHHRLEDTSDFIPMTHY